MRNREINPAFFNQGREKGGSNLNSLEIKIKNAKTTGNLNLSSLNLDQIPPQVFDVYAGTEKFWEVEPIKTVDLSFNKLTQVPPELGSLVECISLKVRDNSLSCIPESVWTSCTLLRHIDFTKNRLSVLSDSIGNLIDLRELLLPNNNLSLLPNSLGLCLSLRILDLQHNSLTSLPESVCSLPHLTHLVLANNKLISLPCQSLKVMRSLQVLNVSTNSLTTLPDLYNNTDLLTLDFSVNKLQSFPTLPDCSSSSSSSSCCKGLTHLSLGYNRITSLPTTALLSQPRLVELLVNNNLLTEVPPQTEWLQSLKVLDLSNNSLKDLPASLGHMETLQHLRLDGNPLRSIRQTLLTGPTNELKIYLRTRGPSLLTDPVVDKLREDESEICYRVRNIGSQVGVLDLSNLGMSEVPTELIMKLIRSLPPQTQTSLTSVLLSKNLLKELPLDLLRQLPNTLVSLDLANNLLHMGQTSNGEREGEGGSVSRLVLANNKLSVSQLQSILIPFLPNLRDLDCRCNPTLRSLSSLVNLPVRLEKINLSFCGLEDLQIDFSMVTRLQTLDVSNNKLSSLPTSLRHCGSLEELSVENNQLGDIPVELIGVHFPCLKVLLVAGNPQRAIRNEVIQGGSVKVIEWIRSRVPNNNNISLTNSKSFITNNNNNNSNNNESWDSTKEKKVKKIQTLKQLNSKDFQF